MKKLLVLSVYAVKRTLIELVVILRMWQTTRYLKFLYGHLKVQLKTIILLQIRNLQLIQLFLKINSLKSKKNFILMKKFIPMVQKIREKVASAAILDGELYLLRLPNNSSIFSAELKAIDLALNHIEQDTYW